MRRLFTTLVLAGLLLLAARPPLTRPSFGQGPEPPVPVPVPPAPEPTPKPDPDPTPPPAPQPLSIYGETDLPAYSLVRLTLDGGPEADRGVIDDAEWDVLYAGDITLAVDGEELDAAGTRYVFTGPPGSYRVTAWATMAGRMAKASAIVTIDGKPPVPPEPPTPPDPPADPLVAALQAAYNAETTPDKPARLGSLGLFYRFAAQVAASPTVTSWGGLFDALTPAAQALGIAGQLNGVQTAIKDHALTVLPTSRTAPLDAAGRKLAVDTFQAVADALGKVAL